MTPAEKDQKESTDALELTKRQIAFQRKVAELCYDYFHKLTSVLHAKIPFVDLPPMYIEAWMGIVKVVLTAEESNNKYINANEVPSSITLSVPKESVLDNANHKKNYMRSGEAVGIPDTHLDFMRRFFRFKKDDSLYE